MNPQNLRDAGKQTQNIFLLSMERKFHDPL